MGYFSLFHNNVFLSSTSVIASCIKDTTWDGKICAPNTTGTLTSTNCTIQTNQSTCNTTLTWSTKDPITGVTSAITTPANSEVAKSNSGTKSYSITYGDTPFFLYHNSKELAKTIPNASCPLGTSWDLVSKTCKYPLASCGIQKFLVNDTSTVSIKSGSSAILSWDFTNCTKASIDSSIGPSIGNIIGKSNVTTVSPLITTTYTLTASGTNGVVQTKSVVVNIDKGDTTGVITADSCKILANNNSCNTKLAWNVLNPINSYSTFITTSLSALSPIAPVLKSNSGEEPITISYGQTKTFKLYHSLNISSVANTGPFSTNSLLLGTASSTASCIDGTSWDVASGVCKTNLISCGETVKGSGTDTNTYGTVIAEDGKCWLDRNLGATQVATAYNDYKSYGSLFQWGRLADGHQLINWTDIGGAPVNGTTSTLSTIDQPKSPLFILGLSSPYNWRNPQNDNLWQGVDGKNNVCPVGFHIPTATEWQNLTTASGITTTGCGKNNSCFTKAANSILKLPSAGARYIFAGYLTSQRAGYYWSSSPGVSYSSFLYINSQVELIKEGSRASGYSVRCIKD